MSFFRLILCIGLMSVREMALGFEYNIVPQLYSDTISVHIQNHSGHTVYLFSSYFDDSLVFSKYLRRYNEDRDVRKISFLPLVPYLTFTSGVLSDLIVPSYKKIVKLNQLRFCFITLHDNSEYVLKLPKALFDEILYVSDVNIEDVHIWNKELSWEDKMCSGNIALFLEFAIYNDISNLTDEDTYCDGYRFDLAARSFNILSLNISREELINNQIIMEWFGN